MSLEPITVRRHGSSGPTIVVLHGGPGGTGSALRLAQALASDFVVLEPLQRRSGTVPLTVLQHVQDLAEIAPESATIVGWSWGAMLGLSYAARHPSRVRALVLIGCGCYDDASRARLHRSIEQRLSASERHQLRALEDQLCIARDPTERNRHFRALSSLIMRIESCELVDRDEESAESLLPDSDGHTETWRDVIRLQQTGVEPRAFQAIAAPVLMIHGDCDPHPGIETRDVLRTFIPRLEYVEVERCGHEPWRERYARERFLQIVRDWVVEQGNKEGSTQ